MSERTSYEPGIPCWIDLASPDLDATVEFYGQLFGWDVPEAENAEQTGGYRLAMLKGKPVAGLMPQMPTRPAPSSASGRRARSSAPKSSTSTAPSPGAS